MIGPVKVWSTKYLLTAGILEHTLIEITGTGGRMAIVRYSVGLNGKEYLHGPGVDWHLTLEGAQARAQKIIDAAETAAIKKLARIVAMKMKPVKVTVIG